VPTGILKSERKRGLVDELTRTVFEVDGHPVFTEARPEHSDGPLRLYCVFNEVPYEDWGDDRWAYVVTAGSRSLYRWSIIFAILRVRLDSNQYLITEEDRPISNYSVLFKSPFHAA
jgi:hypothetical protein